MTQQVVISGIGVMSALGVGIDALWTAMVEGRSGLGRIDRFDPSGFASQVAGTMEADAFRVRDVVPKTYRKATKVMCRDIELAVGAAAAATENAGLVTAGGGESRLHVDWRGRGLAILSATRTGVRLDIPGQGTSDADADCADVTSFEEHFDLVLRRYLELNRALDGGPELPRPGEEIVSGAEMEALTG